MGYATGGENRRKEYQDHCAINDDGLHETANTQSSSHRQTAGLPNLQRRIIIFRTSGKTVGLVAAAALSFMLMGSAATAQLTVDIRDRAELERKEIPVNSKKKIALTAQASGGSGLTFQWELLGVGSLGDVTKSAIFYFPPTTIDGDTDQAMITIRVKDASGAEAQSGVTLTIVRGGGDRPTPTPTLTPPSSCDTNYNPVTDDFKEDVWEVNDCTCIKSDGDVMPYAFHSDKSQNQSWRTDNEAFRKALQLAKEHDSPEALIYAIKSNPDYEDIHRIRSKKGASVYYIYLEKGGQIEFGSCWKKVGEVGKRVFGKAIVERQDIYVLDVK